MIESKVFERFELQACLTVNQAIFYIMTKKPSDCAVKTRHTLSC